MKLKQILSEYSNLGEQVLIASPVHAHLIYHVDLGLLSEELLLHDLDSSCEVEHVVSRSFPQLLSLFFFLSIRFGEKHPCAYPFLEALRDRLWANIHIQLALLLLLLAKLALIVQDSYTIAV